MMKQYLVAILAVLAVLPIAGQANRLFMEDFELEPDSMITVPLVLANESPSRGLQFTLTLPQGIYLEEGLVTSYSQQYRMSISTNDLGDNSFLIFVFPSIRVCYPPDTAEIVKFTFSAVSDFRGGQIFITECLGSTIENVAFPMDGDTVSVTVSPGSLIGIPVDQQPVEDQYFNLLGVPISSAAEWPVAIQVTTTPDGRRDSRKVSVRH